MDSTQTPAQPSFPLPPSPFTLRRGSKIPINNHDPSIPLPLTPNIKTTILSMPLPLPNLSCLLSVYIPTLPTQHVIDEPPSPFSSSLNPNLPKSAHTQGGKPHSTAMYLIDCL
jgi:hypothetical protein